MKLISQARWFVFLFALHFGILNGRSADTISTKTNIPNFNAEGIVSWEGYGPSGTNAAAVSETEGSFMFSYSNNIWQVQFTYNYQKHRSVLKDQRDIAGTMIDYRRIPDGIRVITTFSTNGLASELITNRTSPSALATTNTFPDWDHQEVFLPWLSLCPDPDLPLINSNLMQIIFVPEYFSNPKNEGRFTIDHVKPENLFLSELVVTNNGTLFLADGSTLQLPGSYSYPQFSYKVLDVTNCSGINFPLNTVLYQFVPSSNGKSSKDIYPAVISRLSIKQIDVGGHNLTLLPPPKNIVALDSRPAGLNNYVTVNYDVTNDQWLSLTNKRMKQLANFYRKQPFNKVSWKDEHSLNRAIILGVIAILTLIPLIGYIWKTKLKKSK